MTRTSHLATWAVCISLAVCLSAATANPVITEFMAVNDSTLMDEDLEYSDWIEIHNPTGAAINLDGWHLTDEEDNLDKWRFPAVTLPAGAYLVVFASGEDRAVAGSELHTDFKLNGDGEYLALVQPDGVTIEQEFAPEFPPQIADVSYGLGATGSTETFVAAGDTAHALIPDAGDSGDEATWMLPGYVPTGWLTGPTGVGYERSTSNTYDYLIGLDVEAHMYNNSESAWIRVPFTVADPAAVLTLMLRMKYDDGFVAYLNGAVIAARNEENTPPMPWNAGASRTHDDGAAQVFEDFDATAYKGQLTAGENILAVHGLNRGTTSSDFLILPELVATVSSGGQPAELRFFTVPTPEAPNASGVLGYLDEVQFSVTRGFYDTPFAVELSTDVPDAQIRYTLDGSQPTSSYGTIYTGAPIQVDTTTVIRAAANKSGYTEAKSVSHTYIFLADVLQQTDDENSRGFPDTWYAGASSSSSYDRRTRPADYEMDPVVVNGVGSAAMIEALTDIPTVCLSFKPADLWNSSTGIYPNSIMRASTSITWEKPASMEFIDPDGIEEDFCANAGARILGELARWPAVNDKQSFRLLFKGQYGPTQLETDFFGDPDIDEYDTIVFRANWGDGWMRDPTRDEDIGVSFAGGDPTTSSYLRDIFVHDAFCDTGNLGVRGRFVHLYLNGVYWGLFEAIERPDDSFSAEHLGGEKEEYDVIKGSTGAAGSNGALQEGNRTAYNYMLSTWFDCTSSGAGTSSVNQISDAELAAIEQYLDVDQFIDYMITLWTYNRQDFPRKNWYWVCRRNPAGGAPLIPFRLYTWDSEAAVGQGVDEGSRWPDSRVTCDRWNNTDSGNDTGPVRVYRRLITNATFRRRWGDRVQALMLGDGPLNPTNSVARWMERANEIDKAIIGEAARWGDSSYDWNEYEGDPQGPVGTTCDRDTWVAERDHIVAYLTDRTAHALAQMAEKGLYPNLDPPQFNQNGGEYDPGFQLMFTNPNGFGSVWFTINGEDPMEAISPIQYGMPFPLTGSMIVKARVGFAGSWSALVEAGFMPTGGPTLSVTEIMYNPAPPRAPGPYLTTDYEFIEIQNTGPANVPTGNIAFVDGIDFDFTNGSISFVAPGEYALLVKNVAAFEDRYGTGYPIAGTYDGLLNNDGETLTMVAAGMAFKTFTYGDGGDWPGRADGRGASLERVDTAMDPNDPDAWRSSTEYGGHPAAAGMGPVVDIVINEVLTHTDPDPVTWEPTDAIELYNASASTVNLSGWYLSDSFGDYWKYPIPDDTTLVPGEYVVFDEHDFNVTGLDTDPGNDDPKDFGLSGAHGDDVWLMEADDAGNLLRFVDHVEFGGAFLNESFGRWDDGSEDMYPMTSATLGTPNGPWRPATVLISEVMYNPGGPELDDLEFIEIYNSGAVDVDLMDWRLRKGVDYDFDLGTILRTGDRLIVLSFNPDKPENAGRVSAFRTAYGIDASVDLVGGWGGKLDNNGERVQLQQPDSPPAEEPYFTPHVVHDEVVYNDAAPWPVGLVGQSLHRSAGGGWGNDAANWTAGAASPGTGGGLKPGDVNGDDAVDLDDFVILKTNWGRSGVSRSEGDLNGDTNVDLDDFVILKTNWGT